MSQAVLEVLLSPPLMMPPADSATPLPPAPAAPWSLVQTCPLHVPAAAPRLSPTLSDCQLLAGPPQLVVAASCPPPDEVLLPPKPSPVSLLPTLVIAGPLSPAYDAVPMSPLSVPPVSNSSLVPLAKARPLPTVTTAPLQILQAAPALPPSPLPAQAQPPLLRLPPMPDDPPLTPDDKSSCWTRGGPAMTPAVASARKAPPMPSPADFHLRPAKSPVPAPAADSFTAALALDPDALQALLMPHVPSPLPAIPEAVASSPPSSPPLPTFTDVASKWSLHAKPLPSAAMSSLPCALPMLPVSAPVAAPISPMPPPACNSASGPFAHALRPPPWPDEKPLSLSRRGPIPAVTRITTAPLNPRSTCAR
ncbi:hypothetical protein AX14_010434 [Amanita brunnescens Koide BX004]|nr:hypothetical protein AX14_010434 [Amanita brunnescens Koide BX004]